MPFSDSSTDHSAIDAQRNADASPPLTTLISTISESSAFPRKAILTRKIDARSAILARVAGGGRIARPGVRGGGHRGGEGGRSFGFMLLGPIAE